MPDNDVKMFDSKSVYSMMHGRHFALKRVAATEMKDFLAIT